jgi:hypothetical protein
VFSLTDNKKKYVKGRIWADTGRTALGRPRSAMGARGKVPMQADRPGPRSAAAAAEPIRANADRQIRIKSMALGRRLAGLGARKGAP